MTDTQDRAELLERREFALYMADECPKIGMYESVLAFQEQALELGRQAIAIGWNTIDRQSRPGRLGH